jgi:hypothetical protein
MIDGLDQVDDDEDEHGAEHDSARRAPDVADGDVPPPVVVEAGEDEDSRLQGDDEQDRLREQGLVAVRDLEVEADGEGEVPRRRDEADVHEQVEDAVAIEEPHDAALTASAERTPSTTCSCCSEEIPGQSGSASVSRAAFSVSGRLPVPWPRVAKTGWRWRGVE